MVIRYRKTKGNVVLIIVAFIWGSSFVAQKQGMEYIGPFTFNGLRSIIGAIVLTPVVTVSVRAGERMAKRSKSDSGAEKYTGAEVHSKDFNDAGNSLHEIKSKKGNKRMLIKGGLICGIVLFFASSFQQIGLLYTTSGKSGFITVRMITGDHFETAYQIGKKLGMVENREEVFDCREMSKMTDDELDEIIERTKVFSRVIPEQKYRILTILKRHNITAMTGDGVNDVPALSGADVGIAMGSGSHIAKDAGAIILLDDNFKTIIDAMKEGRTIIANVRRMLFYLLSTNTGELITMIGALLIGIKTPLEPVQILWVNLVTDTSMVIPLGLEPAEKNTMKQPPKQPDAPILEQKMIWRMCIVAFTMSSLALGVYVIFEKSRGHDYAQTLAFVSLVVSQWANAFNARSDQDSIFVRRIDIRYFALSIPLPH